MNFQQLRSIREACRCGYNLTEVANVLYTSQPGVSRQIREVEEELGVDIFERNGKRLTGLTEQNRNDGNLCELAACLPEVCRFRVAFGRAHAEIAETMFNFFY